jgi:hypothetical protein
MTMLYDVSDFFFRDATSKYVISSSFEKEWFVPIEVSYIFKELLLLLIVEVRWYDISG